MELQVANIEGVTAPDYRMTVTAGTALAPEAGLVLTQGYLPLPTGTTGQRYANAPVGSIRYNTTTAKIECKTSETEWSETNM